MTFEMQTQSVRAGNAAEAWLAEDTDLSLTERIGLVATEIETAVHQHLVPPGHPLRLRVTNNIRDLAQIKLLAHAAKIWRGANGGPVWTYTSAWHKVPRDAWSGPISVTALVRTTQEAQEAGEAGYAPALAVESFRGVCWAEGGLMWKACPAQWLQTTCARCQLCLRDGKLRLRGQGVALRTR